MSSSGGGSSNDGSSVLGQIGNTINNAYAGLQDTFNTQSGSGLNTTLAVGLSPFTGLASLGAYGKGAQQAVNTSIGEVDGVNKATQQAWQNQVAAQVSAQQASQEATTQTINKGNDVNASESAQSSDLIAAAQTKKLLASTGSYYSPSRFDSGDFLGL